MQAIYAPIVRDTAISFELEPPTIEEMRQRIVKTLEHLPWLVCERRGDILGYVYASQHRTRPAYQWSVDVSVYVHAELGARVWGRGCIARSLRSLPCRARIRRMRVLRCRTRPVWGCMNRWGFNRSESIAPWAINWRPGTMLAGGNSPCASEQGLRYLPLPWAWPAHLRPGTPPWRQECRSCGNDTMVPRMPLDLRQTSNRGLRFSSDSGARRCRG